MCKPLKPLKLTEVGAIAIIRVFRNKNTVGIYDSYRISDRFRRLAQNSPGNNETRVCHRGVSNADD